jgi:Membrane-fusion protein
MRRRRITTTRSCGRRSAVARGRALLVLGARVTGPSDLLTTVEQVDPIYVSFNPSDRDVLAWRHNEATRKMIADGKLKVAITLADKSAFPHPGVVSFVDQSLQYNTGTLLLRATVPNPEHILLPGQFVRVKPMGITRDSAVLVPQRAVSRDSPAHSSTCSAPTTPRWRATVHPRRGTVAAGSLSRGSSRVIR